MSRKIKITGTEDSFAESLQNCLGEMLVLFLLKQKPMYTYEIMQEINHHMQQLRHNFITNIF